MSVEKFAAYRRDPVAFVRDMFHVDPTPQQKEVLLAVSSPGAKVSVKSGHGTGKSSSASWLILWFLSLYDNSRVMVTAPSGHQLRDVIWGELRKWKDRAIPWFQDQIDISNESVKVKGCDTRIAVARTARRENPDALQGQHDDNMLLIVDEASGVHEDIFVVGQGALSTPTSRVLLLGNPTRTTGYFYDSHNVNRKMWNCMTLSSEDAPSYMVGEQYVADMERQYGRDSDMFRVRVLGEFPRQEFSSLISSEAVDLSFMRKIREDQYSFAPRALGVDVAWEGDDATVITLRQGLMSWILYRVYGVDNMTVASMVAQFQDEHKADATMCDVGWGTGVIDRLRQVGRDVVPVNFGSRANNPERFANKRVETWVSLKEWLDAGGKLPKPKDEKERATIKTEATGPQIIWMDRGGRMALESKKDMKRRGLASPDIIDSLAMTFALPLGANAKTLGVRVRRAKVGGRLFP